MAWLTRIIADAQVEYRLRQQAGCAVVESSAEETVVIDDGEDAAVDYRLRSEGGAPLVWMGSGLGAVGLAEGEVLDEEGRNAARRLMNGCHPATGARLITTRTAVHAHPKAQLTTARVVEAIVEAAEKQGMDPAALLEGKPKQQRVLERMQRMVHRQGERHRMQVETLHKLVRAVGLSLADIYSEKELADAWAHKDMRVDSRVRGWDFVFDLPKSDSILQGLMDLLDEQELRALVHQAKRDTFGQIERWCGYAVGSEDGEPVRLAIGGLLAWSVEHQSARPVRAGEPGDPHLHLHVTIANLGLCEDGTWRSIANSGNDLHAHAGAADAYFKARVRALLYERFGVRRERNERTGAWEIVGIPAELRDAFSRRAALVDEQAGTDAGRQEKAAVSMAAKRDKLDADATTMRDSWRRRAEEMGIDVDVLVAAAAPGPPGPDGPADTDGSGPGPRIPPPTDLAATVFDPRTGLTKARKSFSRAELLAAVASQSLTCNTSLLYGHGANAFATYPGISRAKKANHLWLPLAVLEDEQTQARLGTARSEKELLQRAIAAFAQFLGQSRPDGMISDLLDEPPAPAQLPLQRDREAAEARADAERELRRAHAARALTPSVEQAEREAHKRHLAAQAPSAPDRHAVVAAAVEALRDHNPHEVTRRIAEAFGMERPPRDVEEAAAFVAHIQRKTKEMDARLETLERKQFQLSDEQKQQLARIREEHERLAIPSWKRRPYGALGAADLAQQLEDTAREAGRAAAAADTAAAQLAELIAQERAGSQPRGQAYAVEAHRLLDQADALVTTPRAEQDSARVAAWEVIHSSDFAAALGALQEAPEEIKSITARLAEMRSRASRLAHDIDKQTREELAFVHGQLVRERQAAQTHQGIAKDMRAETQLRDKIAKKHPTLHAEETTARHNQDSEVRSLMRRLADRAYGCVSVIAMTSSRWSRAACRSSILAWMRSRSARSMARCPASVCPESQHGMSSVILRLVRPAANICWKKRTRAMASCRYRRWPDGLRSAMSSPCCS